MFADLLVPLDGSELAARALPYAATLVRLTHGRLVLVRVVETWASTVKDAIEKELDRKPQAEAALAAEAARLREQALPVDTDVYVGEAAAAIDLGAASHHVDTIVMSTHGRGGVARLAYGSVAERVLRRSHLPVLLIPPHAKQGWPAPKARIVVPLDGSALAESAVTAARELARVLGASITVLQVIEPPNMAYFANAPLASVPDLDPEKWAEDVRPYGEEVAQRLRNAGLDASGEVRIGYVATSIVEFAEDLKASAIVMATHGRTGLSRAFMGSVANGVISRATMPVLAIRPTMQDDG
ncbi:MAG: universal stress protein [Chloroflexi bacterium]|nr:universal stress protein [Chloroflexota bacterium]